MTAPAITLVSVSKNRISAITGMDTCEVVFTSDQDIVDWEARADGAGLGQGLLVGAATDVRYNWDKFDALVWNWDILDSQAFTWNNLIIVTAAGSQASFIVENEELTNGDKTYRINIYVRNAAGEWTPYGS